MSIDVDALKAKADIVAIVGHYVALKKRGAEFLGKCPFHSPDNNPSFYVVPAKGIYHCFACGASGDVISFLMEQEGIDFKAAAERLNGGALEWKPRTIKQEAPPLPERVTGKPPKDAAAPDFKLHKLCEPSKVWTYRDGLGDVLGYVCRYETPEGKQIRAFTWGARGDRPAEWACGHWTKPRPLYGLDRLTAKPQASVLMVEGEKAADAAAELLPSYAVLTWPGGAQAWKHADLAPLKGRKALLWPDNDEPGIKAMAGLAAILADPKGLGCTVRIIDPTGQPKGFDAADWTGTRDELIAWAKPRASDYDAPQQNPAPPQEPDTPPPSGLPIPGTAEGAGPDELPPLEAYAADAEAKPKRRKRPHLAAVAGNAVPAPDPEAAELPQALSEDHLADAFAEDHHCDWKYVRRWDKWFKWDGGGWVEDDTSEVFHLSRNLCRAASYWSDAASLTALAKRQLGNKRLAGNVRDMAGTDRRIAATADQWDRDPWMLGVPDGVIDLRDGKLVDAQRDNFITKRTSVSPASGPHPLWDKILARATRGDATLTHYLCKWAGYMLTGDTREEAFLFVHGPGGSGKSTFVQVLRDCMGTYAKATRIETFMSTRHGEHPTEIADLAGARLVSAPETEEGSRWNEGRIKMLTGRDKVKARFMGQDYFEFEPVCKIMIFGNHRPRLHSVGEEMKRRLHLVEFPDIIPSEERDPALKLSIKEEYPAILQWMVDGCLAWQQEGLGRPEAVSSATDDYLSSQDTLGAWIEECCDKGALAKCQVSAAYRSFESWAKARGEYVPSVTTFSEKMQARGIDKRKISVMYFIGLSLKDSGQQAPQAQRYPDA